MQPNRVDLTKILKIGDKVFNVMKNGVSITGVDNEGIFVLVNGQRTFDLDKYGYLTDGDEYPFIYPSSALEPWPEPCPFEKGELVWVNTDETKILGWIPAYFNEMDHDLFMVQINERNYSFKFCLKDCPLPLKIDVK